MKKNQTGMVLIMTMVVLVMVTGLSVYALKRSILGEQITKNMRSQAFAKQMAEGALRFCEDALARGSSKIGNKDFSVKPLTGAAASQGLPSAWAVRLNWKSANVVPASAVVLEDAASVPDPLCMVEEFALPVMSQDMTAGQPYLVTAIGYTSDYRVNGDVITSGAEVWLQSIVRP